MVSDMYNSLDMKLKETVRTLITNTDNMRRMLQHTDLTSVFLRMSLTVLLQHQLSQILK